MSIPPKQPPSVPQVPRAAQKPAQASARLITPPPRLLEPATGHIPVAASRTRHENHRITIPRVWRSELGRLSLFFISLIASIALSYAFPRSVIIGEFARFGSTQILLHLPLFWLVPVGFFFEAIYQIYNVRYQIDRDGIICRVGIISFRQSITRIRYEDVRSIESDQNLIERLLDVGDIQIGTAATGHVDVMLRGIGQPMRVREVIQGERERKIRGGKPKAPDAPAALRKNMPPPRVVGKTQKM